jgi:hypothetical protein
MSARRELPRASDGWCDCKAYDAALDIFKERRGKISAII